MQGYKEWFNEFGEKQKAIVNKLIGKNFTQDEIIDYFDFESMCVNEVDFCVLYKDHKKCHDIKELNCYMCACDNFRFDENGIKNQGSYKIMSECNIGNGENFGAKNVVHQDCSSCSVPHHKSYVKKRFSYDWFEIMKDVDVTKD